MKVIALKPIVIFFNSPYTDIGTLSFLASVEDTVIINGKTFVGDGFEESVHANGNFTPLFWVPFLLVETASFALVLLKAWRYHGTTKSSSTTNISHILIRDNLLYYLLYVSL